MMHASPVTVLLGPYHGALAAQTLPSPSYLLPRRVPPQHPGGFFAHAPAPAATRIVPTCLLSTMPIRASECATRPDPEPIQFVGPGLPETRTELFDTIIQRMSGGVPIALRVEVPEVALGDKDELIEFFRSLSWLCGTTERSVRLEILLPDMMRYAAEGTTDLDVIVERCRRWVEWAMVIVRELPYGAAAIGRELPSPRVTDGRGSQRRRDTQLHGALQYYRVVVTALMEAMRDNIHRLPEVPVPEQPAWDLVRALAHRLNNLLTTTVLLELRIKQCVEQRRTDIVPAIQPLLPPRDLASLWNRLTTIVRDCPRHQSIRCFFNSLPADLLLLPHGEVSAETQILLLDEMLTELLRNAHGYAHSHLRLEAQRTPAGDLALRVTNDVAQQIDRHALAGLGSPGSALPGIQRSDSSRMGLYTVIQMAASLSLPRPTFTAETTMDGAESFVATVVIPAARFRVEEGRYDAQ